MADELERGNAVVVASHGFAIDDAGPPPTPARKAHERPAILSKANATHASEPNIQASLQSASRYSCTARPTAPCLRDCAGSKSNQTAAFCDARVLDAPNHLGQLGTDISVFLAGR